MIQTKKEPDKSELIEHILHPLVKQWFYSRFKEFSLPQRFGILEIHSRKNVLISAPTGSSKTLTSFLAILNELVDNSVKGILENRVYCVYVSPLKALGTDIGKNLMEPLEQMEALLGKPLGIRIGVRSGDTTNYQKSMMLEKPPHILVTTPESLGIVLSSIKFKTHLQGIQWLIIDEIHALAENKRGVHLSLSIERLALLSDHMTRIGLSATIAPLEEIAQYLVGTTGDCTIIDVAFLKQMDLQVMSPVPDLITVSHIKLSDAIYETIHTLVQQHKTTLIFTNTRAGTERVVDHLKERYPSNYIENIGAHHGSLSAQHRTHIEENLRAGKLKVVVTSSSLELGIDIGYIDLVICLGSPKSVARCLQRAGRSGHQLHATTKCRILIMDRDDLVECAVLLKSAIEKKIDRIQIPKNALDVLAQHIFGMAIEKIWNEEELFTLIRKSYCYATLKRSDFNEILEYLAGNFATLEDRYIYAKIWRENGQIGKRGKMARVLYMTNIGTIPDQTGVLVKINDHTIGMIEETFLEKLNKGDIFVLGGSTYTFKHAKGMVAQVETTVNRPPTVPSWFSEMLPLSYDLALEIGKFRRLMEQKIKYKENQESILKFIHDYLYVDENAAHAIYRYFYEQYAYLQDIPHDKKIIIEHYTDETGTRKTVLHALYGRRVNDVLSRALAFAIGRSQHRSVGVGINDNGFYLEIPKGVNVYKALKLIKPNELEKLMAIAIEDSEILKRRFRHCASRALMILRNYKGRTKRVGKQQVSSTILLNAVRRISNDFSILREARREVLEDQMDIVHAKEVFERIEQNAITIVEKSTDIPSPFAFSIVLSGALDVIRIEDKQEFLTRMHQMVIAKIHLGKKVEELPAFTYNAYWKDEEEKKETEHQEKKDLLKTQFLITAKKIGLDPNTIYEAERLIEGDTKGYPDAFLKWIGTLLTPPINKDIWSEELITYFKKMREKMK